ncbi:MAG: YezD family protein [Planctomycetia bacterium]|nr:YezD family protein [Planctomycetia bacterium]
MSDRPSNDSPLATSRDPRQLEPTLEHIRQALVGLQFGEVSIIVQDGVVVQVERIERKRFRRGER